MRSTIFRHLGLAAITTLAIGCDGRGDLTSPGGLSGPVATRAILGSPVNVRGVTRDNPLLTAQTTSAVIGAFGGSLSLPGAGLSVVVPPFAVTSPVRITVRAVSGALVAYEFEPHGTRFLVPLVVTQNLTGTSAARSGLGSTSLVAGYFANVSDLNPLAGTALVSELLSATVSLLSAKVTFPIFHFSGYLVATGDQRTDPPVEAPPGQ